MSKQFHHKLCPRININNVDTRFGRYYVLPDGTKLPSVTTLINFSDEFDNSTLKRWKQRVGKEQANAISTQARNRGSAIHNLAEKYLNNDPAFAKGAMPFNLADFKKLQKILDEHVDLVYGIEYPVYSKKYGTAGKVDLIGCWISSRYSSQIEPSVIDFKTSKKPKSEKDILHYFVQAATYAILFEEINHCPINQIVVIVLVDHDEPQIFVKETKSYLPLVKRIFHP